MRLPANPFQYPSFPMTGKFLSCDFLYYVKMSKREPRAQPCYKLTYLYAMHSSLDIAIFTKHTNLFVLFERIGQTLRRSRRRK